MRNELLYDVAGFIRDELQDHFCAICGLLEFIEGNNSYLACEGSDDVLRALNVYLKAYSGSSADFIIAILDIEKRTGNTQSALWAKKGR